MEIILRQMDLWYRTSLGAALLEAEREALVPCWEGCFGKFLLQIGGPGESSLFRENPAFHFVRLSPERMPVFRGPSVRGQLDQLPFLPESLDIILLPHVLEFMPEPQNILAQSYAALVPGGSLVILGFNPWSLWGLYKTFVYPKTSPWKGQFYSLFKIKKLLTQQAFAIEQIRTLFFRPPFKDKKVLKRWMMLEVLGRLLCENNGGVYVIVVKKQVIPLIFLEEPTGYEQLKLGVC